MIIKVNDKYVEVKRCKTCNKQFYKLKKRMRGTRRLGLINNFPLRKSNCVTCCSKCSRDWSHNPNRIRIKNYKEVK